MNRFRSLLDFVVPLIAVVFVSIGIEPFFAVAEDDVRCLRGVKNSLRDPEGRLGSWDFFNSTSGFICNFVGVSCWHDQENRAITLALRDLALAGSIPSHLQCFQSLQNLDLSGNNLTGSIPSQICTWLPYLVTLDLSNNQLDGSIPPDLGNCSFLNTVLLSNNRLSRTIPVQLANLGRLNTFSVANNDLTGPIPSRLDHFNSSSFAGNDLCGKPLGKCGGLRKKNLAIIIAAGVFGAAASLLLGLGLWWWYSTRSKRKRNYGMGRDDDTITSIPSSGEPRSR